jgi:uncharacterized protein YihD (DUF1040 family)
MKQKTLEEIVIILNEYWSNLIEFPKLSDFNSLVEINEDNISLNDLKLARTDSYLDVITVINLILENLIDKVLIYDIKQENGETFIVGWKILKEEIKNNETINKIMEKK